MSKEFTFYRLDGVRQVFEGETPAQALNRAGYGAGAIRALDFYAQGDNDDYEWRRREWKREAEHG